VKKGEKGEGVWRKRETRGRRKVAPQSDELDPLMHTGTFILRDKSSGANVRSPSKLTRATTVDDGW